MKKTRLTALILGGIMLCLTGIPALAADTAADASAATSSAPASLPGDGGPDSLLYYGTVRITARDGQGRPAQLSFTNDQGTVLALTADENTAWVDSGKHAASDPATLKDGEQVYVALDYDRTQPYAPLPSAGRALAVLRNIPQDGGCAQYHVIGDAEPGDKGQYTLTVDNGGLFIFTGETTGVSGYDGSALTLSDLKAGDTILASAAADIKPGNALPLANIPVGTVIHNIELYPGKGAQLVRSAGVAAQLMAKENGMATVRLPSGEYRKVRLNCIACIGQVGNVDHANIAVGKAGRKRHMGIRPTVRGSVMNPCDHPHGGGEGKAPVGRPGPVTPWGKPAMGYKTRKKKNATDKFIVKRRNAK